MALCEAMISGVPVLSSDCPTGPRQILAPHTFDFNYALNKAELTDYGVLLPTYDKPGFQKEWTNSILHLLKDEQLRKRITLNAAKRIEEFDREIISKKWFNLVNELYRKGNI
jgi:glycosyltransferase involved in cell wall biosynthesis